MFTKARAIAMTSSLLLSVLSGQVLAVDTPAKIDPAACATPSYPLALRTDEQQGDVLLSVLVDANGNVSDAKVVQSSGFSSIDKASLRAGVKCKFKPGVKNGEAAPSLVKMTYSWVIN
jgi:TonB family protein